MFKEQPLVTCVSASAQLGTGKYHNFVTRIKVKQNNYVKLPFSNEVLTNFNKIRSSCEF